MKDEFEEYKTGLTSPAREAVAVTPDDVTDLADPTRAVFVGGSGDLSVRMISGQTVTFSNIQGGVIYPLRVDRVLATGTTATGLLGLR